MNGTFTPLVSDVAKGDVDRYIVSFRPSPMLERGKHELTSILPETPGTDLDVFHDIVQ